MTRQTDHPTDRSDTTATAGPATLTVENVGGIDACTVEFTPGVTVLAGRNATNRTSLLRALSGALGGTAATLKSDADEGRVGLALGDAAYTREYARTPDGIEARGDPYTDDETLVDLFVTMLEDNAVRRAVARGDDLHDVIMRPVDTEAVERRIRDLREERRDVEAELRRVRDRRAGLSDLRDRRRELEADIATIDDELDALREEVTDVEATVEVDEEARELVDELDERRQDLGETEAQVEVVEAELDALRDDLADLRDERGRLPEYTPEDRDDVERELQSVREQKRRLDETVANLTTIVEFNEDVLAGDEVLPGIDPDDEAPPAELAPEEARDVVCWTCGSRVDRRAIDGRLDDLRAVTEEKRGERADLADRASDLEEERAHVERVLDRRQELDRQIEATESKIERRERRLDDLEGTARELRERIHELEDAVAQTDDFPDGDLLGTYEEISDRQYERGQLEQQLAAVEEEIAEIEATPEPDELAAQRDDLARELERERNRIDEMEAEAVDAFNEHMAQVLDILGYENIARVWIERKQANDDGTTETTFELHVVRENESGSMYEDSVAHLSESEREVVGLVVALAGYLVHEVYETVPFVLLDSVEAIDAARIGNLVAYFAEYAPYLVVALLPEDAEALSDDYDRVTADALGG